jgi:hypothetical protein
LYTLVGAVDFIAAITAPSSYAVPMMRSGAEAAMVSRPVPPTWRATVSTLPAIAVTRQTSGTVAKDAVAFGTQNNWPTTNIVPSATVMVVEPVLLATVVAEFTAQRAA